jgi:diadenosine tetraphosphatase ApaH/serine/threonine PP2A family protein phosphatase
MPGGRFFRFISWGNGMKALISDIHGNLEALTAVLEDIDSQRIEEVYCLGDIVGYGCDSESCIDIISTRCKVHLLGNHDWALLNDAIGFNAIAKQSIACIRKELQPYIFKDPDKRRRWDYLQGLKEKRKENDFLFVHASPRDPITEYVLPSDPHYDVEKMRLLFDLIDRICFVGHTHIPGVFTPEPDFYKPDDLGGAFEYRPGIKFIVNIGSVGQPRDRDPRASYVTFDEKGVRFHRVPYDYNVTMEKIKKHSCFHDRSGLRLAEGR